VTITGTDLTGASAVAFGSTPAASFTVVNSTTITAVSPARPAGIVDVRVTTPGGQSAVNAGDTFKFRSGHWLWIWIWHWLSHWQWQWVWCWW
jgi:hypothetical protein